MKCVSVSVSREVSGRICEWKMLPRNDFMALYCLLLFMQNLFLLHQQLVMVLVARIRLLWILEVLIQLRRRRHRSRFHSHWIFPRPAESWFEIHLHLFRASFLRSCSVEICEWVESFDDLLRLLICSEREHSREVIRHDRFIIHVLQNLMTQWRTDVKEQMIFSPDKIFTASKASRRNLWSFVPLANILVGAKSCSH